MPRGGLNDTFTQIFLCWRYCQDSRPERESLYISDQWSLGTQGLLGSFFYINPLYDGCPEVEFISNTSHTNFSLLKQFHSVYPDQLCGNIHCLKNAIYLKSISNYVIPVSSEGNILANITDIQGEKTKVDQDLLIHLASGGGWVSPEFMKLLRLHSVAKNHLRSHLTAGVLAIKDFAGVHVRNTDNSVKGDWREFIAKVEDNNPGRQLFICSDDRKVVDYCLNRPTGNFFSVGEQVPFLKKDQIRLHDPLVMCNDDEKVAFFVKALLDLIFLAKANKIYTMKAHSWFDGISGFTKLAVALRRSNNDLLALGD